MVLITRWEFPCAELTFCFRIFSTVVEDFTDCVSLDAVGGSILLVGWMNGGCVGCVYLFIFMSVCLSQVSTQLFG